MVLGIGGVNCNMVTRRYTSNCTGVPKLMLHIGLEPPRGKGLYIPHLFYEHSLKKGCGFGSGGSLG